MISAEESLGGVGKIRERIGVLFELLKFRLASLIAFSGAMGYCLGAKEVETGKLIFFIIASIGITGAANIINQILEKDFDKLMKRTANRPLPSGRITVDQAIVWAVFLGVTSLAIFVLMFNLSTGLISLLSLVLYGFVYTPLKRVGPIAVFVGAFPGAFPPMIGWVAATNHFGLEPGILFAIQFFWQFPHFWAIAWVLDEDYKRAGFKLLPANGLKDVNTTLQIMIYTVFLLPIGWLPYELGMTGINSAFVATVFGVLFLAQTFHLMRTCTDKTARQLMFGSFIYLPIVQIAFLLDKL
ncbi:heme o synthase [Dyadobacter chenwenxiniae]|uniref:Protoheme IX farnesyltransferase n=1 Tax=Dyadobacter chenwenxiniae TaxID=2906456 RepID=A0A9X1PRT5_9BACT|nr:heme o synthase [Dyadobacter chenwenxiniae]MCF0051170.1 heme o synthase [Dyadobacter chenwenxiniae]MCF0064488.1 heme o synthase [Dyadobacter chenwenxiniae]UON82309.1 heme o synthase [Dyadobacter chenwenxiniae]